MDHAFSLPYCTVKGFRRCLELLGRSELPPVIDREFLLSRGFSPHAVYPVLGALRFLKLVDESGAPTDGLGAFLVDDLTGRPEVVARAYSSVLDSIELPVQDREELDRVLVEKHGCAPGVAPFCSTFFLWLLAEAGMPVTTAEFPRRRGRPPAHLSQLSPAARQVLSARAAENAAGQRDGAFIGTDVPEAVPPSLPSSHRSVHEG